MLATLFAKKGENGIGKRRARAFRPSLSEMTIFTLPSAPETW